MAKIDIEKQFNSVAKSLRDIKIENGEILTILGQEAKPMISELKAQAPVDDGGLRDSITLWPSNKKPGRIWIGPGIGGAHAHLVEYGTVSREMTKGLRAGGITQKTMQAFKGPSFFRPYKGKSTGVMPANNFIQRSLDNVKDRVSNGIVKSMTDYFIAQSKKEGFKTT